jgi:hypothetical protein
MVVELLVIGHDLELRLICMSTSKQSKNEDQVIHLYVRIIIEKEV